MTTDTRLLIYIDKQRFSPEGSYEVFYHGDVSDLFSYFFVFKCYCSGFNYIMACIIRMLHVDNSDIRKKLIIVGKN